MAPLRSASVAGADSQFSLCDGCDPYSADSHAARTPLVHCPPRTSVSMDRTKGAYARGRGGLVCGVEPVGGGACRGADIREAKDGTVRLHRHLCDGCDSLVSS